MARKKALWMQAKQLTEQPKGSVHSCLVTAAAEFLWKKHCIVITEMTSTARECADAIGFGCGGHSTLIEAKASRADFMADRDKVFRRESWMGMGEFRYFIAPKGLLSETDIPSQWGFLEVDDNGRVKVINEGSRFETRNVSAELDLLMSALRRTGNHAPSGVSVKVYTYETKNRATLGVEKPE